jgi:hypothetical protein
MFSMVSGLGSLLLLAGDVWAIINIVQSKASDGTKVLWVIIVLLMPFIGLILWFLLGPRNGRS